MTTPLGNDRAPAVRRSHSAVATASLVLGILSPLAVVCGYAAAAFFTLMPSIVAVALGHQGMSETVDAARSGRGQAVAGLILGYLGLALFLLYALANGIR